MRPFQQLNTFTNVERTWLSEPAEKKNKKKDQPYQNTQHPRQYAVEPVYNKSSLMQK